MWANNIIASLVFFFLLSLCTSEYLDDESFGMEDNPSWWKTSDESDENTDLSDQAQLVDRRSFNRFLSKHKSVIPYFFHEDGINYGGRPSGGFSRPWSSRPYGIHPSYGLMSIRTRSGPFGINKRK